MDRKAWIIVTLCVIGMVVNGWWMVKHPPPPPAPAPAPQTAPAAASPSPGAATPSPTPNAAPAAPVAEETVELKNAAAAYTFTTKGGGISKVLLLDTKDQVVINKAGKAAIGALGMAAKSYDDVNYRVIEKTDKSITFEGETADKLLVQKNYRFSEGPGSSDHLLDLKITLTNRSGAKVGKDSCFLYAGAASELRPDEIERPAFAWNNAGDADRKITTSFRDGAGFLGMGGPILEFQQTFDRLRWAGVMSRFYATLISTVEDQSARVWAERFLVNHAADEFKDDPKASQDYAIHGGLSLPPLELDAAGSKTFNFHVYLGPKIYNDLKSIDEGLASTEPGQIDRELRGVMFYGKWLGWISCGLAWALRFFHDMTGNWGVAIILLTLVVRSLLWPLQARSNAQMKKMGKLSPMLKELQEKYKDDQQRFAQEQMKLFREYGVNPVGGCLPLLIQFPIFIAFYTVLRFATELRGQPFIAWVRDLSLPDTVASFDLPFSIPFIGSHIMVNPLPLLMGLTMFVQMKLTPQPTTVDPMQRRIFMLMPFMFLFFCYTFASALALYWTFTNIFMIVQAQVTRLIQKEDAPLVKVRDAGPPPSPMTPISPFQHGHKHKKDRPHQPRPGGGGTRSTRKKQ